MNDPMNMPQLGVMTIQVCRVAIFLNHYAGGIQATSCENEG